MSKLLSWYSWLRGLVLWGVSLVVTVIVGTIFGSMAFIMSGGSLTIGVIIGIICSAWALGWAHDNKVPEKIVGKKK